MFLGKGMATNWSKNWMSKIKDQDQRSKIKSWEDQDQDQKEKITSSDLDRTKDLDQLSDLDLLDQDHWSFSISVLGLC